MLQRVIIIFTVIMVGMALFKVIEAWPLIYPQKYFRHNQRYRAFNIYSDREINEDQLRIFDEVHDRLAQIDIYDPNSNYDVFLCQDPDLYWIFANKMGKPKQSQGFNLQPVKYTFVSLSAIQAIQKKYDNKYRYNILEGSISHIIAHEIAHELITMKVGLWKGRTSQPWKKEGYCEYAASHSKRSLDSEYSLLKAASQYFDGYYDDVTDGRRFYIRAALLVEYLLDVKKVSFDDLMESELDQDLILKEIKNWVKEQNR
jgi:hypothetical protein